MDVHTVDELFRVVVTRLAEPGYQGWYSTESDFEADVWKRLLDLFGADRCLTSHKDRLGRSASAWEAFCAQKPGPDVDMLGSRNRLDIVVQMENVGSVGVEVKCLGDDRHAGKFTQGLGQAVLALANRHHTVLAIHCGTVTPVQRASLRDIAEKISQGSRTAIVVAP